MDQTKSVYLTFSLLIILWCVCLASSAMAIKAGDRGRIMAQEELSSYRIEREGEALEVVRQRDVDAPVVEHDLTMKAKRGESISVEARIDDRSTIASARLHYRRTGEEQYVVMDMEHLNQHTYRGVIPDFMMIGEGIEYYLTAFDEHGNGPGSSGTDIRPHRIGFAATQQPGTTTPISFFALIGTLAAVILLPKYVRRREPLI